MNISSGIFLLEFYSCDSTVTDSTAGQNGGKCCLEELYEDPHNLHGSGLDGKNEDELICELRKLAVIAQNNMVNVVSLRSIPQDRDHDHIYQS